MKQILKDLYRSWTRHTGTQVATLSILVAAFTVVAIFLTASLNMRKILSHWGESVNMTVYLQDGTSEEEIQKITEQLGGYKGFEQIDYVSKTQAKEEFDRDLSSILSNLSEDKDFGNPFPASFRLKISESLLKGQEPTKLASIVASISDYVGVEDVSYGQDWVENYRSFLAGLDRFGIVLVVALLFGGVLVIGNSLRSAIVQRRDEIEILELVGATYSTIRNPYLIEGVFMGFLSGVLSLLISYTLYHFAMQAMSAQVAFFSISSKFSFLSIYWMLLIVVASSTLGLIGSYLSVRSLNHGWLASQRVKN